MLKLLENLQTGCQSSRTFQASMINDRVLNLAMGQTKLQNFHFSSVNALDIEKAEERYLLSGGKNGGICIHDLQNTTGKVAYKAKVVSKIPPHSTNSHHCCIETVQWYPSDNGIFSTSGLDSSFRIYETKTMTPIKVFKMPYKINCHHISSLTAQVAVGFKSNLSYLMDIRSSDISHKLKGHRSAIPCLQWSPVSEHLLVTGSCDSKILFWDIRSTKDFLTNLDQHNREGESSRKNSAHNGTVNGLCFTHDGHYLVSCGTDDCVRLWNVALGTNTLVNYGPVSNNNRFRRVTMDICQDSSPPALFMPSANRIVVFDLFSGEKITQLVGHDSNVNCVSYRSCVNQLFSSGNDMNIFFWTSNVQSEKDEKDDIPDLSDLSSDEDYSFDERGPSTPAWSDYPWFDT